MAKAPKKKKAVKKFDPSRIVTNAALPDPRPVSARKKDFIAAEVATAAVVPFKNEKPTKLGATDFNQWYVGSCVPHSFLTQLEYEGIINKATLSSQLRLYRKRSNYPGAGSIGVDIYDKILAGLSLLKEFPTPEGYTEAKATAMTLVPGTKYIPAFKYFQYVDANGKITPDLIPGDIALGKAVTIFFYATEEEWAQKYVTIKSPNLDPSTAYVRHCVCIMPRGDFTEDGKKWLAIQDSAKFGNRGLRYVDFEFIKKRVYFAGKVYPAGDIPPPTPPVPVKPTVACKREDRGAKVSTLQQYLVDRQFLESQYVTGYYGALTAKAVLWWQLYNHDKFTTPIPGLLDLKGEVFGPESLEVVKVIS